MLIGALLCYASFSKISQISMFAYVIQQSIPFFGDLDTPELFKAAHAIIFVEMLIGISLIVHLYARVARAIAIGLFILFSGVLVVMLIKDKPLSCGCLGISPDGMGSRSELLFGLVRNFFLIGILLTVSTISNHPTHRDQEHEEARIQNA